MNPSGNGLGLHISRNICQALGGDLTVISTPGEGSTFKMTMECRSMNNNDSRVETNQSKQMNLLELQKEQHSLSKKN